MGVFRQFPYSNFHEMNLDEIIKIVKNMLEEWAQYYDTWEDWKTQVTNEWSEMQNFINNYFDNLDVQEEINNKIIAMVNTGEFADIVEPFIPPEVSSWLADHITQPVGVVIDTSLSVAGACADAKATGDAINVLQTEITAINNAPTLVWNIGKTISSAGVISNNDYTALTDIVDAHSGEKVVYTGSSSDVNQVTLIMYIATYRTTTEPNDTFVARTSLWNNPIILDADITGYRIMFGRATSSGISIQQSDITDYFSVDIYRKSASSAELKNLSDKVKDIAENLQTFNHSTVLFETAKSYLNVAFDPNNRLAYEEGIGLFQPETRNIDDVKCISCSQFIQACLSGIDFAHSRYVENTNECAEWGFVSGDYGTTMTEYGDYLTSNELGTFFEMRGQVRELSKTSPQAKVGDLLLFNNGESFYHCALCTGVTPNRIYFLHASDKGPMFPEGLPRIVDGVEAGVYLRYLPVSSPYYPTNFVSINDVITDTIPIVVNKVLYDNEAKSDTYSTPTEYIKRIVQDINAGLYTAKIMDDGTGDSRYYLHIWYYKADGSVPSVEEEETYSEYIEFIKHQNEFKSIFYAQLQIRNIDIRCMDGTQYGYESMELYDNAINY